MLTDDATIAAMQADRAAGMGTEAIARKHGRSSHTVRRYAPAGGQQTTAVDPVAKERARIEAEAQRREHIDAVKELGFREFLSSCFAKVQPIKVPAAPKLLAAKGRHDRFPLLHLSDWHFEEIVKSEAVMGLNEYDTTISRRRVFRVVQSFIALARDMEAARFRIPELVVALNGDFLSGTLHGLERHSDAENVVEATLTCGTVIAAALRDLSAAFPKVRVYCTVGNHGRFPDDKKVPTKDPTRSFDYIAYRFAQAHLKACSNIDWNLPQSYGVTYEVGGHLAYQGHGNFIKQQMGIVGYGMRRFTSALGGNLAAAGKPLKYAFFGHFHSENMAEFAGMKAFIGPSLIGTQEYGFLSGGGVNRAAQCAYIFDRDLGHVTTETLYADGPGFLGTYGDAS